MSDPLYRQPMGLMAAQSSDKTMVVVTYVLFLMGFFTGGLTTLIGLVMAYMLRGDASELALSHYVFLAHTFWKGLIWLGVGSALLVVGIPLSIILIGIPLVLLAKLIFVVAAIWYGVRCSLGLIAAMADRPYGAPRSWLV